MVTEFFLPSPVFPEHFTRMASLAVGGLTGRPRGWLLPWRLRPLGAEALSFPSGLSAWPGTAWALNRCLQNECEHVPGTCRHNTRLAFTYSPSHLEDAEPQQCCPPGRSLAACKARRGCNLGSCFTPLLRPLGRYWSPRLSEGPQLSQTEHLSPSHFPGSRPGL